MTFDEMLYLQVQGTAMGTIFACGVLRNFEKFKGKQLRP